MGFAVLLALIAYFFLAKAVAKAVEKKTGSTKAKYVAIAVFVLIPTWDIVPGWLYFEYLCQTEGRQKIYKTVELPPEYFLKAGEPDRSRRGAHGDVAIASGGELNRDKVLDRYSNENNLDRDFSTLFHIAKSQSSIHERETGKLLGTATSFWYYGGWLLDESNDHGSLTICPTDGHFIHGNLWHKVFRPITPIH